MELEVVIGLETHVQLKTKTKLFCSCSNDSENAPPNTNICPICLAHPGTLPVINREALVWAIRASLMLNCSVDETSYLDRKNYFYPDLPKGYQISQFAFPIGRNGSVSYFVGGERKNIHLERLHIEEDAAKSAHEGKETLIDFNRAGTPLCEIVTKPEFNNPEDAKAYLQTLKLTMRYLNISDADMEKGQLRCDANISLRPKGEKKLFPKTEVKNLNSFRSVEKALHYEIKRQKKLWEKNSPPKISTTRGWNETIMQTEEQRSKEESHDYRYFPDPDLPPLKFTKATHTDKHICTNEDEIVIECLSATLPERPADKIGRFILEYAFSISDAESLIQNERLSEYAENVISALHAWLKTNTDIDYTDEEIKVNIGKTVGGWLTGDVVKNLREKNLTFETTPMLEKDFAALMGMHLSKKIPSTFTKRLLANMVAREIDPVELMTELNITVMETGDLSAIVEDVMKKNATVVKEYKAGKEESIQFLIGMVMRASKGSADPKITKELLISKMKK